MENPNTLNATFSKNPEVRRAKLYAETIADTAQNIVKVLSVENAFGVPLVRPSDDVVDALRAIDNQLRAIHHLL